jgi:hypothetical protein
MGKKKFDFLHSLLQERTWFVGEECERPGGKTGIRLWF